MKRRHLAMAAGLLGAAALFYFGDSTPEPVVAEAVERKPPKAFVIDSAAAPGADGADPVILALAPRATLIGDSDDAMGQDDNVFGRHDWNPPPPPSSANGGAQAPPPPPMAPPLPFTFLGKAAEKGEWEVFLSRGDKTYLVRKRDVIDGVYRVDAIAPPNLTLTYLPLNQVQQLNIGVTD